MSEPQAAYDTDDPQPTSGPWRANWFGGSLIVDALHQDATKMVAIVEQRDECEANGELIAAAGTAASELPDEYDAVKVLEMLPKLIRAVDGLPRELLRRQIARVTPDADGIIKNLNAARGDTDE